MEWDETLSDRLREMWKHHSSNEIEAILRREGFAVSRSAIMGRVRRMKLPFLKSDIREPKRVLFRRSPRPRIPRNLRIVHNKPATSDPLRKTLFDLEPRDCRWPVGSQDGHFVFCGCPRDGELPYCAEHWKQSRIPVRPLRQDTRW